MKLLPISAVAIALSSVTMNASAMIEPSNLQEENRYVKELLTEKRFVNEQTFFSLAFHATTEELHKLNGYAGGKVSNAQFMQWAEAVSDRLYGENDAILLSDLGEAVSSHAGSKEGLHGYFHKVMQTTIKAYRDHVIDIEALDAVFYRNVFRLKSVKVDDSIELVKSKLLGKPECKYLRDSPNAICRWSDEATSFSRPERTMKYVVEVEHGPGGLVLDKRHRVEVEQ